MCTVFFFHFLRIMLAPSLQTALQYKLGCICTGEWPSFHGTCFIVMSATRPAVSPRCVCVCSVIIEGQFCFLYNEYSVSYLIIFVYSKVVKMFLVKSFIVSPFTSVVRLVWIFVFGEKVGIRALFWISVDQVLF